mmetsp:Transcript_30415/g.69629  ORF Transcript_30415/g.69629 Transcript_30415/m.69629 type:complete len:154 (-) Transcript_30415:747-1208(-)
MRKVSKLTIPEGEENICTLENRREDKNLLHTPNPFCKKENNEKDMSGYQAARSLTSTFRSPTGIPLKATHGRKQAHRKTRALRGGVMPLQLDSKHKFGGESHNLSDNITSVPEFRGKARESTQLLHPKKESMGFFSEEKSSAEECKDKGTYMN